MSHASLSLSLPLHWMDKLWLYKNSTPLTPHFLLQMDCSSHALTRPQKHPYAHLQPNAEPTLHDNNKEM